MSQLTNEPFEIGAVYKYVLPHSGWVFAGEINKSFVFIERKNDPHIILPEFLEIANLSKTRFLVPMAAKISMIEMEKLIAAYKIRKMQVVLNK